VVSNQTLYLITDALGRRVFEINAATENETWTFPPSQSANDPTDPKYLNKPVDAFIYRDDSTGYFKVVITDQDRNRIITIDKESGNIDWWYGDPLGREGNGFNQLRTPEDAEKIGAAEEYIIADKGNNRVIIVEPENNTILWELTGDVVNSPVDIQYILPENNILITDQGHHRVILVHRDSKSILWQFGKTGEAAGGADGLKLPTDADYLPDSNTYLITDAGNERIIEVDQAGNIIWQFHRPLKGLRDADRVNEGRTLVVRDNYPVRLAYTDSLMVSPIYDLGENKESIFDSLRWSADTTAGMTQIWLQFRSANSLGDLEGAFWYGPTGSSDYYTRSGMAINTVHRGHRFYQFRAFLRTNNPLKTPVLHQVLVKHHYYRMDALEDAYVYTPDITEETGYVVVKWKKLEFKTILPSDAVKRDKISLEIAVYDGETRQPLERFAASKVNENNAINLEAYSAFSGIQSIYLVAYLSTLNSSVTPILDNLKVTWEAIPSANSEIYFADRNGYRKPYYRATQVLPANESRVDSLYIKLKDPDLEPFQTEYSVKVSALDSKDSIWVNLDLLPAGGFFSSRGIPILISNSSDPLNYIIEAGDRDELVVSYQDAYNTLDFYSDTIMVIKNTTGTMTIEDQRGNSLSKVWFDDVLYVRVKDENDRNLSATIRDSIHIQIYDRVTMDEENVVLYELPSGNGRWDSGEFYSNFGFRVVRNNNGFVDNGQIETLPGHNITAEYIDNVALIESVIVPDKEDTTGDGGIVIYFGRDPYIAEVAPNPYYGDRNTRFGLRVASNSGSILVKRIEVYNLAGEKVREINADQIVFREYGSHNAIPKDKYGYLENWWDLRNSNGQLVSSGTYWAKIIADLINIDTGRVEQVSFNRKFVVIR
ncbi:hypothetical protein JXO59_01905, partial [candidate division KSB1 bacterium]|nr:hypothetical protein [candidate division KSB1 bacterium]